MVCDILKYVWQYVEFLWVLHFLKYWACLCLYCWMMCISYEMLESWMLYVCVVLSRRCTCAKSPHLDSGRTLAPCMCSGKFAILRSQGQSSGGMARHTALAVSHRKETRVCLPSLSQPNPPPHYTTNTDKNTPHRMYTISHATICPT